MDVVMSNPPLQGLKSAHRQENGHVAARYPRDLFQRRYGYAKRALLFAIGETEKAR